jgi:hypothetical protein
MTSIDPKREKEAMTRLLSTSLADIQREAALNWAYLSRAAFTLAREDKSTDRDWEYEAEELKHEALEHAALSDDDEDEKLRDDVRNIVGEETTNDAMKQWVKKKLGR